MYYGAYHESGSGRTVTNAYLNRGFNPCDSYARRSGGIESYIKRWYILGLLMLVIKGRNGQNSIGYGQLDFTNYNYPMLMTGTTDKNGLFYGREKDSNNKYMYAVKCFGIENMWGIIESYTVGIFFQNDALYIKSTAPYPLYTQGYTSISTNGFTRIEVPDLLKVTTMPSCITNMDIFENGSALYPIISQGDYKLGFCDAIGLYTYDGKILNTGNGGGFQAGPFSMYFSHFTGGSGTSTSFCLRAVYA